MARAGGLEALRGFEAVRACDVLDFALVGPSGARGGLRYFLTDATAALSDEGAGGRFRT
jgi:hypothetical protein